MARPTRSRGRGMEFIPAGGRPYTPGEVKLQRLSAETAAAARCTIELKAMPPDADATLRIQVATQRARHLHEAHCLAVELTLATRQPSRYGMHAAVEGGPLERWREPDTIR